MKITNVLDMVAEWRWNRLVDRRNAEIVVMLSIPAVEPEYAPVYGENPFALIPTAKDFSSCSAELADEMVELKISEMIEGSIADSEELEQIISDDELSEMVEARFAEIMEGK